MTRSDEGTRRVWVPARFLGWDYDTYGTDELDPAGLERAYSIWGHANDKLNGDCTEFDRIDVVTTLKRSVTQRVSALKKAYGFNLLPLAGKPKRDLDILHRLGLIRPLMLRSLIEIRNALEHEDVTPPDHKDCLALTEFVWYFLKSTDPLLRCRLSEVEYAAEFDEPEPGELVSPDDYPEHVTVYYLHPNEGPPSIVVRLPKLAIKSGSHEGYLEIVESQARRNVLDRDDLTIIQGAIVGPVGLLERLWVNYFKGLPRSW